MRTSSGRLRRAKPAGLGVEVAAVRRPRDVAGADQEGAEALAGLAVVRVGRKQRVQGGDDAVVLEVLGVELRQPRALERAAEIEVVAARTFAHEADLRDV